jgi:hypothetical protein
MTLRTAAVIHENENTVPMDVSSIIFSPGVNIKIVICSHIYFPRSVDMTWS